jgi:nucleotide sugar dehydrogenase
MDRPIESETTKIMENSYRATILAFMDEWSTFAERNGIDIAKVIKAIKMRPTHNNMIFPGPGIGGYCLPKDGGLGYWSYNNLLGFEDDIFKITPLAIDINDTRSLSAAQLARDALRDMGKNIGGAEILVCGASYRQDVGDTRYSGSEVVVRKLTEMGALVSVHDPYVKNWPEFEDQEQDSHSKSRFFRNQDGLVNININSELSDSLSGVDAVVLAVPHSDYLQMKPEEVISQVGEACAIIDCFCILNDEEIKKYLELGCDVKGLGRGHIKRIKDSMN